jgi:predicted N-acyltransferase
MRAGGRYYPKWQLAVPFTPVPGRRLLIRPGSGLDAAGMGRLLIQLTRESGFSSLHVTFCREAEAAALAEAGFLRRRGVQFHWQNPGYRDFEDFLGALASRKRKTIRRERREAAALGLSFRIRRGAEIPERIWDGFHEAYLATVDRKWGGPYLTRAFFSELAARLGERVVLITAEREGDLVAGALNLLGTETLYGRNWATLEQLPFLHFELCYYQAIEFAIALGLKTVQAGAQGEHKLARGYVPVATHSAHWFAHRGLARAVEAFLRREAEVVAAEAAELEAFTPYRRDAAEGTEEGR